MVEDTPKNKLTLAAEIIGIIGGIVSIISFTLFLFGFNNTDSIIGFLFNPLYAFILFIISILILITVAIRKKMNNGKTDKLKHWHVTPYRKVCYINAYDMKWDVEIPEDETRSLMNIYKYFDISPEPKCMECNTKLEHHDNIYWYTYSCFKCSFKKRTWSNLEKLNDHVSEEFKIEIENRIKGKK